MNDSYALLSDSSVSDDDDDHDPPDGGPGRRACARQLHVLGEYEKFQQLTLNVFAAVDPVGVFAAVDPVGYETTMGARCRVYDAAGEGYASVNCREVSLVGDAGILVCLAAADSPIGVNPCPSPETSFPADACLAYGHSLGCDRSPMMIFLGGGQGKSVFVASTLTDAVINCVEPREACLPDIGQRRGMVWLDDTDIETNIMGVQGDDGVHVELPGVYLELPSTLVNLGAGQPQMMIFVPSTPSEAVINGIELIAVRLSDIERRCGTPWLDNTDLKSPFVGRGARIRAFASVQAGAQLIQ